LFYRVLTKLFRDFFEGADFLSGFKRMIYDKKINTIFNEDMPENQNHPLR